MLTASIIRRFGVGGTLQIAPASILLSSIATVCAPGVVSAGAVRLTEASTRYTLNRTGMELLYMPLPQELRNRMKAFIDICVDRLSRGLGGVLLIFLTITPLHLGIKGIAIIVMALCIPWIYFSHLARREYVATIRKRFESRQLDFANLRIAVQDQATIRLLESTLGAGNPRQAAYALSLLAEAPRYDLRPVLLRAAGSPLPELRGKAFEIAAERRIPGLPWSRPPQVAAEVAYALATAPDRASIASAFLDDPDPALSGTALEALRSDAALAGQLLTPAWLERAAASPDGRRRALAAGAIGVLGGDPAGLLAGLIQDPDPDAAAAACRAAGTLKNRDWLFPLIDALAQPRLRAAAIPALAAFGATICGTLSDFLHDPSVPIRVRRQLPRVLRNIPDQRSVDVLLAALDEQDLDIAAAVLRALNHLRETAPTLNFNDQFVSDQIYKEARHYYELNAALQPFLEHSSEIGAARLLARTIRSRLEHTLERLFRLLGLRYPPKAIYFAYLAVSHRRHEEATAALEFLDNLLDRRLKRILLPLLDAPEHLPEHGKEIYGLEMRTAEDAIRELIRSSDPWLAACAIAAAAELHLRNLAPDIRQAAEDQDSQEAVWQVARAAQARLAA